MINALDERIHQLEARQRVSDKRTQLSDSFHPLITVAEVLKATYEGLRRGSDGVPIDNVSILVPRKKRNHESETGYLDTLMVQSAYPDNKEIIGSRVPYGQGVTGRAARSKTATTLSDIAHAEEGEYFAANGRNPIGSETAVPLLDDEGELVGVFEAQSDNPYAFSPYINGLLQSTAKLLAAKLHGIERTEEDYLCPNLLGKKALDRDIPLEVLYALRNDYNLSFACLDIDNFKTINDTFGHQRGDEIISDCGDLIADQSRESDLSYHSGGDEYIIVLPETEFADAQKVLDRLVEKVRSEFDLEFSFGVSSLYYCKDKFDGDDHSVALSVADALYSEADKNLYEMKGAKKGNPT